MVMANAINLYAQHVPFYSNYQYNPYVYNPSFAGSDNNTTAFLTHRQQWMKIEGAPSTTAFTLDGSLSENKSGLGLSVYNHQSGLLKQFSALASYAYQVKISGGHAVRFGLSLGVLDNTIQFSKVRALDQNDDLLLEQNENRTAFDGNFGMSYFWKDLTVGFSMPHLFNNKVNYYNQNAASYYRLARHYLFSAQYNVVVSEEHQIDFTPLILTRLAAGVPFQVDVNLNVGWQERIWVSMAYKSQRMGSVGARVRLSDEFSFAYSYDFNMGLLSNSIGSSHEVMMSYTFGSGGKGNADLQKLQDKLKLLEQQIEVYEQRIKLLEDEIRANKQKEIDQEINLLRDQLKDINDSVKNKASDKELDDVKTKILKLEERLELLISLIKG